jgi:hypothetical protein
VVISIYDIQRAVADKATVPIYYESRAANLGLIVSPCFILLVVVGMFNRLTQLTGW